METPRNTQEITLTWAAYDAAVARGDQEMIEQMAIEARAFSEMYPQNHPSRKSYKGFAIACEAYSEAVSPELRSAEEII